MIKKRRHEKLVSCFSHFANQWFVYISSGQFEEAIAMLDDQEDVGYYLTIEDFYKEIYDLTGTTNSLLSHPEETVGDTCISIHPTIDGLGYHFNHSLPIEGQWSELILPFVFIRDKGFYRSCIEEILIEN